MNIYLTKNGTQTGPFSEEQITGMLTGGIVKPSDLAWSKGSANWQPLRELLELSDLPPILPERPSVVAQTSVAVKPVGPSGVGGFLLLFCVVLTMIRPVFGVSSVVGTWASVGPILETHPMLAKIIFLQSFASLILVIYGFLTGCIIWSGSPNGRSVVRNYLPIELIIFLGVTLFAFFATAGLWTGVGTGAFDQWIREAIGGMFRAVTYFLIWWFYFRVSKRVRNTYGDQHI